MPFYWESLREVGVSLGDEKLKELLTRYPGISGLSSEALSDAVDSALVIRGMSQFETSNEAMNYMASELEGASFSKKVSFLATYLEALNDNYEDDMLLGGPTYGEDRWDDDLHLAMKKQSIENGGVKLCGRLSSHASDGRKNGKRLGIKEAFGVGFRTAGGGHRTLVLTDPNTQAELFN